MCGGVGIITIQVTADTRQNRFFSRDVLFNRRPAYASFLDRAGVHLTTTLLARLIEILH